MTDPQILMNAFDLPPLEAMEFFRSKGMAASWDWYDVWEGGHSRAFTVAKAVRMDVLEDIRGMVDRALAEGLTFEDFKKQLEPRLRAKGWWGKRMIGDGSGAHSVQLGSPRRLKNIYATNLQSAYMAGRYKGMVASVAARPWWQYMAVRDSQTRPAHAALNAKIFPWDDPFWDSFYPPNGWGCRCRVRSLSQAGLDRESKKGRVPETSEGKLSEEERLVSRTTGELRPVQVYRDPATGERIAPDVGWSYNPGKASTQKPVMKKRSPEVMKAAEKSPAYGLMHDRPAIRNVGHIGEVLQEFDKKNPGIFKRGFQYIKKVNTSSFLSTDLRGGIFVSGKTFARLDGFNPFGDLKAALNKIKSSAPLTFHEEYAIEGLWHEITHNRVNTLAITGAKSHARAVSETLTQFLARHTYPTFMESLGAKAQHFQQILSDGYGYGFYVANFRKALAYMGITEAELVPELLAMYGDHSMAEHAGVLTSILADKTGRSTGEIQKVFLAMTRKSEKDFAGWLDAMDKGMD